MKMNTRFTIEELAAWIENIKEAARNDRQFSVARFPGTKDSLFSIVAGWHKMPLPEGFCISKSNPDMTMCIKVAVHEGPALDFENEFEKLPMPIDNLGDVDDTCIPLEWSDSPKHAAQFFMMEWERIMEEYGEEI